MLYPLHNKLQPLYDLPILDSSFNSTCILVSGNIAVHIFTPESRQDYDLETLWTLGPKHDDQRHYVQDDLNLSASDLFWLETGWNKWSMSRSVKGANTNTVGSADKSISSADKSVSSADDRSISSADDKSISSADDRSVSSADDRSISSADDGSISSADDRSISSADDRSISSADDRSVSGADSKDYDAKSAEKMDRGA